MKRRVGIGVLVAALTAILAPAAHGFGGDLSTPADNPITCDMGWPSQSPYSFVPPFYGPFGQTSCAWLSGGTTTSSYAPATGRVTSVSVRVGATTGPMRVVVLRSLFQNSTTPGKPFFACCVAQAYSAVFTPGANAVTTVPTSIAVEEDPTPPPEDLETIAAGDALGLEVLAPGVPVPAHVTNGGATDLNHSDFGWFPALSRRGLTTPSTNVVVYDGDWSGFDVLLNGAMGTGAVPALRFPDATLPVRDNRISLPLRCVGAGCQGTVRLQNRRNAQVAHVAGLLARARKKVVTYGSATFKVKRGKTGHVKVKLNRRGRALARRKGPARVWANLGFKKGSKGKARSLRLKLTG